MRVDPDDVVIPPQDDLNRMLFKEMLRGQHEARRSHRTMRILVGLATVYFAVGGYIVDRQHATTARQTARIDAQTERINAGRRVSSNAVCAFGGAIAEAGRAILDDEARAGRQPRGAGQAYIDNIAMRVEKGTGIKGLVIKRGPEAGNLDCRKLARAAKIS